MIARIWHGTTTPANAAAYEKLLVRDVVPGLDRIDGYHGAYLLRRELPRSVEFVTLTMFESLEAIRAFAGDDVEAAVVAEPAARLLSRLDERSVHYETLLAPGANGVHSEREALPMKRLAAVLLGSFVLALGATATAGAGAGRGARGSRRTRADLGPGRRRLRVPRLGRARRAAPADPLPLRRLGRDRRLPGHRPLVARVTNVATGASVERSLASFGTVTLNAGGSYDALVEATSSSSSRAARAPRTSSSS